jgi:hypothetical protein
MNARPGSPRAGLDLPMDIPHRLGLSAGDLLVVILGYRAVRIEIDQDSRRKSVITARPPINVLRRSSLTVADEDSSSDIRQAMPVSGSFIGSTDASMGIGVEVSVTS